MVKIVDLTKPIKYYPDEPAYMRVEIEHKSREENLLLIEELGLPLDMLPEGFVGISDDTITMGVHSATHVDAPWHYGPLSEGKKAPTIDEIPLDWFYGDGVVIDMSHKKDMELISQEDLEEFIIKNDIKIKPRTIVLIRTDGDKRAGTKEYDQIGPGVSRKATEWLIDQGIRVMGIDNWGWDRPLAKTAKLVREENNPDLFWESHRLGQKKMYCHIEQIVGLRKLPKDGFKVIAMPLPLEGCSGSPIRLIAIFDD
ncbi:MAG: cyclase family protein [Methanobacterium sp.]|nr:cyclase family protein [Methanobacterium sp.]